MQMVLNTIPAALTGFILDKYYSGAAVNKTINKNT